MHYSLEDKELAVLSVPDELEYLCKLKVCDYVPVTITRINPLGNTARIVSEQLISGQYQYDPAHVCLENFPPRLENILENFPHTFTVTFQIRVG